MTATNTPEKLITPNPMELQDSVTHINIGGKARTELGRLLNPLQFSRFNHPIHGPFHSMEAFWAYIQAPKDYPRRDELRYLHGMEAKKASKQVKFRQIKDFQEIIIEANYFKIKQNPRISNLMVESTLPFEMYYIFRSDDPQALPEGVVIHTQIGKWLKKGFEDIRTMLREGREPPRPDYSESFG